MIWWFPNMDILTSSRISLGGPFLSKWLASYQSRLLGKLANSRFVCCSQLGIYRECPAHTWAMAPHPSAPWAEAMEPWIGWFCLQGTLDEAFTWFVFFFFKMSTGFCRLPWWLSGKESACNAGDAGSVPGSGRSPGGGHGNHSSILAWRIPWTEELGGLQSTALLRVRHDRSDWAGTQAGLCLILSLALLLLMYLSIFGWAGSSLLPGLSVVAMWGLLSSCSTWASHCGSVSCCGPQALEHGLSSCGTQA